MKTTTSNSIVRRSATGKSRTGEPLSRAEGFSLIEAMVSMVVLAFLILGIFAGMIQAYRLAAHTRYRDHARYILKSMGDQFLVQSSTVAVPDTDPVQYVTRPLFTITTEPTGAGLSWQGVAAQAGVMKVTVGAPTDAKINDAIVTRDVRYLSNTGAISGTPPESTAGLLLRGDFKISYVYNGKTIEQSLSLVRRVP